MTQPADNIPLADTLPHPAPINPGSHPLNHVFDRVLTILFLLALAIPLVGTVLHWDIHENTENRALTPFPSAPRSLKDAAKLSDNFFAWFKDHFGFRDALIHSFNDARFSTGLLTGNDKVVIGKDNWLFLCDRSNQSFLRERGFEPFTSKQLDQWQHLLETRTAYLKARGYPYLFIIAPDKHTIYPELLPPGLARRVPTRLDQLIDRLHETHSPVVLVDLRAALLAAKGPQRLYFRTDTHWNDFGARVGAIQIMKEVSKALPNFTFTIQPRSYFKLQYEPHYHGDLVRLLGLEDQYEERVPHLVPRVQYTNNPATQRAPADPTKPRLYMSHDSFTNLLIPFLGPHFDHPLFANETMSDPLDPEIISRIKPQIVMTEMVERYLFAPVPHDPPEIANTPVGPRKR